MKKIYTYENKIETILTIVSLYTFYNCCIHNIHLSELLFLEEVDGHKELGKDIVVLSSFLIITISNRHLQKLEHLFHKLAWYNLTIYFVLTVAYNYLYEIPFYNGLSIAVLEMCILLLVKKPVTKAIKIINWIFRK